MAYKSKAEIPTIDCALVTISVTDEQMVTTEFGFDTASQISVEPQIETTDPIRLIVKGILRAQKNQVDTLTGNQITLTDNVFNPELVLILQGGTILYDPLVPKKIAGYIPPVAGSKDKGQVFKLNAYSARYDTSGQIIEYEKITYPNCQGTPVAFSSEDDVFRVPEYVINSAPKTGEAPYEIHYVQELPVLEEPVWPVTIEYTLATPTITDAVQNGLTATINTLPSPVVAGATVDIPVTLTGTTVAAGVHTITLASAGQVTNITINADSESVTSSQDISTGIVLDVAFIMPAQNVNDLSITHTFIQSTPTYTVADPTITDALQNGLTLTVESITPKTEGTTVLVTSLLNGTALAAGTHTVTLTSGGQVTTITTPTDTFVATASETVINEQLVTEFTMPGANVNDLTLTHTFVAS